MSTTHAVIARQHCFLLIAFRLQKPLTDKLAEARSDVDAAKAVVVSAKEAIERIEQSETRAPAAQRGRRGTAGHREGQYANMLANPLRRAGGNQSAPLQEAKASLERAEAALSKADKDVDAILVDIAAFKDDKLITKEEFIAHAKECTRPVIEDYIRLFIKLPGTRGQGDYQQVKKCYFAAAALNPIEAMTMDHAAIEACIKDLRNFDFDEFREVNGILDDVIEEIPAYLALLTNTTDTLLSSLRGAAEYDKDLEDKAAKDPSKQGKTWKDDPIEVARRAWEWWRLHRNKFVYLSMAARLVVLAQVSSASVERIFSQLKLIIDAVGVSALKDNLECRLFERMNEYPTNAE